MRELLLLEQPAEQTKRYGGVKPPIFQSKTAEKVKPSAQWAKGTTAQKTDEIADDRNEKDDEQGQLQRAPKGNG